MTILVAYASKHGATRGIAERIAETLRTREMDVEVLPVRAVKDLSRYDAFVIGSAVYLGKWRKEAAGLVLRNSALLASRPVWLFSSGPIGDKTIDDQGRDVREVTVPNEIAELAQAVAPREHRVFFGALDHANMDLVMRMMTVLPAARKAIPEGDWRDWDEIEGWAAGIADELAGVAKLPV